MLWVTGAAVFLVGSGHPAKELVAEADGNRTRQGAFAPSPVLKTGGPTRRPDASDGQHTRGSHG
jgi:hypothetical protein